MDLKYIQQQVAQRRKQRLILLCIGVGLTVATLIIMVFYLNQNKITRNDLQLSPVEFGDFAIKVVANGQFKSRNPSLVTVKQEGVVQEILVEQGQYVELGTVLLKLTNDNLLFKRSQLQTQHNNAQLEFELISARLALELVKQETEVARLAGEYEILKAQYSAQKKLAENSIISSLDLMTTQVRLQNLERQHYLAAKTLDSMNTLHKKENILAQSKITDVSNEISALESHIEQLKLLANERGQIQKINAKLGENLSVGMAALELSNSDDLQFVAQVPEREAQRIQPLSQVNIRVNGTWLGGEVERVSPNVDNGFVDVFIRFERAEDLLLRQDLSARVEITTQIIKSTFFTEKRTAKQEHTQQDVWIFDSQREILTKRTIHFGAMSQQKVVITNGVNSGELLVSYEQSKNWGSTAPKLVM